MFSICLVDLLSFGLPSIRASRVKIKPKCHYIYSKVKLSFLICSQQENFGENFPFGITKISSVNNKTKQSNKSHFAFRKRGFIIKKAKANVYLKSMKRLYILCRGKLSKSIR